MLACPRPRHGRTPFAPPLPRMPGSTAQMRARRRTHALSADACGNRNVLVQVQMARRPRDGRAVKPTCAVLWRRPCRPTAVLVLIGNFRSPPRTRRSSTDMCHRAAKSSRCCSASSADRPNRRCRAVAASRPLQPAIARWPIGSMAEDGSVRRFGRCRHDPMACANRHSRQLCPVRRSRLQQTAATRYRHNPL